MSHFKNIAEFMMFHMLKIPISLIPWKLRLSVGKILGSMFFHLDKRHRLIALSNLETAFGSQLSRKERKNIAHNSFMHFGRALMEIIGFHKLKEEQKNKLFRVKGEKNIQTALQEGKGILLFTAHYGNWEIAASYICKKAKLSVIARALDNRLLEKELLKYRMNIGEKVIYKHQATKQILQALRAREVVAFLIDQNVLRSQAVFVDFFGRKAATTPSLAAFYLRTKSPILPAFSFPISSHAYLLKILSPLKMDLKGNYDDDVLKITQICTKIIEDQIRKNPNCWFWFHNRWKTRPEGEKLSP